ncbi:putative DUF4340 domain-containing protein [Gammaproteobacteria bacterium]
MNRLIRFLGIALGVQLVLAVFLGTIGGGIASVTSGEPLLHFDSKAVDRITIEQPNKAALVLEHHGNSWSLPVLSGFAALTSKTEAFVGRLVELRKRIPIATSSVALKRFKVSPAAYEHKVTLAAGDKTLATLWLGDSPGFRQVYGRADNEDAVYNLDLAVYEVSPAPNQWADKTILNLKSDEITQITLADLALVRSQNDNQQGGKESKKGKWQVTKLAPGEELNSGEVETLVSQLANLTPESVLGKENQLAYRQEAPVLTLSVTTQAGEQRSYVFSKPDSGKEEKTANGKEPEKGTEYILKSSSSPHYFKVADFTVKELLEAKRDKLITPAKTTATVSAPTTSPTAMQPPLEEVATPPTNPKEAPEVHQQ